MRPGPVARHCVRGIHHYRASRRMAFAHHHCRFEPSCSRYAEQALLTRAFPVAALLTVWRVVRCTPLTPMGTRDPLRAPRRSPAGSGGARLAAAFATLSLSGVVVLAAASIAEAVGVHGGCTATVNGTYPSTMTWDRPLWVHKGERIRVVGQAPAAESGRSETTVTVSIVEGLFGVTSESHAGTGGVWGGTVNVDNYLKYGSGLYLAEAKAVGADGWTCTGSGYIKLYDDNPITKPIGGTATGLTVIGGLGVAAATRARKPRYAEDRPTAKSVSREFAGDAEALVYGEPEATHDRVADGLGALGCFVLTFALFFLFISIGPAVFEDAVVAPVAALRPRKRVRIWQHGHPIAGFLTGLMFGFGGAVLLQQFAIWPLTPLTVIVFPVLVGVVAGVRAYLGTPYTLEVPAQPPAE